MTASPHLDGRITGIVSSMEQLESRRVNLKETYEKQRVDVMSISRELQHTESSLKQKVGGVQGWQQRAGCRAGTGRGDLHLCLPPPRSAC